ncbi:pyocin activator PrtN family protein [Moritella dasanensis]|uniref:pyocin activator PrtN family protein n=1 Tax=Moritella dasanensis TaxID=428031 RepID=UPI00036E9AC5|nr:pyocin activator PrtN family protein [Moritella dasanensis]
MMTVSSKLQLTTRVLLAEKFNHEPLLPLEQICQPMLGLSLRTAKRRAALHELPFPVFRMSDSQKSTWLVNFDDLADYIERRTREHRQDWIRSQV